MLTDGMILDLITEGLITVIIVAAPPLLMGLIVGLLMSIFQTVTSIQEQTLAFIPKILAVLVALILFGPFMVTRLREYVDYVYEFFVNMA